MYDYHQEKNKILLELMDLDQPKAKAFRESIEIARSELKEFARELDQFEDRVSHLVLFKDAIKFPFQQHMSGILKKMKDLILNESTDQQIQKLSENEYEYYLMVQEIRIKLLEKIAKHYLGGNHQ